ncbi:hypothetical protein VY88_09660 [Azospirillum thiophilum]|uniref:DUF3501 domain-containing protein n=1 Tax=Azospirillum thiophilum TaxID=528244 RepID=A0AAC8VUZ6_9PROT|nr:DUF3501 family protein [Azospirillum thiophilum]ALG70063.1 hypothetical protein AL072_03045 [Azospirillum thiophilum]KJR66255.1 hypothetical protein VY88_09660 [Azospirillum thiophilum]
MTIRTEITRADILPMDRYARERAERRKAVVALKRSRRIAVGPYATFHFENYETMLQQVHEMLHIEKGGEEQIADELGAYNPLVPKGRELVATVMFEIDDPERRQRVLGSLGGVEDRMRIQLDGQSIAGRPESDLERTNEAGKTSSVHFIHFDFTAAQVEAFRRPGAQVLIGIDHPDYGHLAVMPEAMRAALAADFA